MSGGSVISEISLGRDLCLVWFFKEQLPDVPASESADDSWVQTARSCGVEQGNGFAAFPYISCRLR